MCSMSDTKNPTTTATSDPRDSTTPLPPALTHAAAWRGEELFGRENWLMELTGDDLAEIDRAVCATEGRTAEELERPEDFPLAALAEKLRRVQHDLEHGSGAVMLQRVPVEKYSEGQVRRIFWALARHIGTPISQSAAGERIFSVRDEGFKVGQPQARGPNTNKRLSFHTDRCDVIAFLCLQPAQRGGENQLVSSMAVYNEMLRRRPDLVRQLLEPYYYRRHNVDQGNDRPYCRQPIFSFTEGHFACSYLRVLIDRAEELHEVPGMSDQQRQALDYLEELAGELCVTFHQQPGDVLFLNNWVTLHRRGEFEDHEAPELRRHILRIWLSTPNSRPIDPLFADNFGSTAAGAIRGGMRKKEEQ